MVDCSSARIATQKGCVREIDLRKGVLVAADDDGGAVAVKEQDVCLWVCREEEGLESEVEVGVCRAGEDCSFEARGEQQRHPRRIVCAPEMVSGGE